MTARERLQRELEAKTFELDALAELRCELFTRRKLLTAERDSVNVRLGAVTCQCIETTDAVHALESEIAALQQLISNAPN